MMMVSERTHTEFYITVEKKMPIAYQYEYIK